MGSGQCTVITIRISNHMSRLVGEELSLQPHSSSNFGQLLFLRHGHLGKLGDLLLKTNPLNGRVNNPQANTPHGAKWPGEDPKKPSYRLSQWRVHQRWIAEHQTY